MSVSESFSGESTGFVQPRPQPQPTPDITDKLTDALGDMMMIQNTQRAGSLGADMFGRPRGEDGSTIIFRGKLLGDAEALYPLIDANFKKYGYTATLQREGDIDIVIGFDGLIVARKVTSPTWVHALLLAVTIMTTAFSGAAFSGISVTRLFDEVFKVHNYAIIWVTLQAGAPFAITLLLILGIHEMGHYIAARRHGIDVTLPYFIPLPFLSPLGTLGAVIFIKDVMRNRKSLFDVGISGPLAGFVVALIAFIIGMHLPATIHYNAVFDQFIPGFKGLGMPILLEAIGKSIRPGTNLSIFATQQPVVLAAWFGMLLTVLNLLPLGQLDGGHVMYTLFGRFAWYVAYITFAGLIIVGVYSNFLSLIFYAGLAALTGLRHPPPSNDITPLDWRRKLLGYATLVLFFLIVTPTPFLMTFR